MFRNWWSAAGTLLLAFLFLFSIQMDTVDASTMPDIPNRSASEINYLLSHEIINGYPDGLFRPKNDVTREEAVTMVARSIGLDGTQRETVFTDVPKATFGSGYIQSAVEQGIIPASNSFAPKRSMTRGEMALLLEAAFQPEDTGKIIFSDIPKGGDLADAVGKITAAGFTAGFPDGTFGPNYKMTREQFSQFVARAKNPFFRVAVNPGNTDKPDPIENPSHVNNPGNSDNPSHVDNPGNTDNPGHVNNPGNTDDPGHVDKPDHSDKPKNVIAIDAGHGGSDPGALGLFGIQEKELNLDVALKVEQKLKRLGIEVVMTRRTDTYLSLQKRIDVARSGGADAFVSIHGDAAANASAGGTETYYSAASTRANDSKQLATFIQKRLVPALETRNRHVKTAKFYVIHRNSLPSALVELGFVTNRQDAQKLASQEYREKAADAIALGIKDYYDWKKK